MQWGVHLPQLGRGANRERLTTFARAADEMGVHSGWVSDHIAWPADIDSRYPYTDDGHFPGGFDMPWLDPFGTMMFVAACTERMQLGATVLILGYRPPVLTAKFMATLDVLSEGRAILGVGVGWMREEFEVLGMPWDHRGARADEQLDVFEALFTEETPSYDGTYYSFPPVGFSPKPPQGRIPVWVGGNSEPAFRRAATRGDVFHAAFQSAEEVATEWARVRELAAEAGRDGEVGLSLRWYLDPEGRMDPSVALQGSAQEMVDRASQLADLGVSHVLLDPVASGGSAGRLDALATFMSDVAPQVG